MSEADERMKLHHMQLQEEVIKLGWNGILLKYHPDINLHQLNCHDIFQTYKEIYDDLYRRGYNFNA